MLRPGTEVKFWLGMRSELHLRTIAAAAEGARMHDTTLHDTIRDFGNLTTTLFRSPRKDDKQCRRPPLLLG